LIPSAASGALEYLDINDNNASNDSDVVTAIEAFLGQAKNLKTLSLSDSNI